MEKILIVVDMQNDFISGSLKAPGAEEIISKVRAKIEDYNQKGYSIVFTKDTHDENYLSTQEGKNLPVEH